MEEVAPISIPPIKMPTGKEIKDSEPSIIYRHLHRV